MYNDGMKSLTAKRLKELREEKGLTFEKLAYSLTEKYGDSDQGEGKYIISVGALKNYEVSDIYNSKFKTGYGMNIQYLSIFADFYDVSTDYLLGRTDSKLPDIDDRAIQVKTGLSDKAINVLMSFNHGKHGKSKIKYKDWDWPAIFNSINIIVEEMEDPDSFLNILTNYREYNPEYHKKRSYTLHQDSGDISKTDGIDGIIITDPNLIVFNAEIIENMFLIAMQKRLIELKKEGESNGNHNTKEK